MMSGRFSVKLKADGHDFAVHDLVDLASLAWCGHGEYLDPSGSKLPLWMASADRIDHSIGYTKDNVRLILLGANLLRGDTPTDESFAAHLTNIKRQLPMLPAGRAIPESGRWARWVDKDQEAEEEQDEEEALWWVEFPSDEGGEMGEWDEGDDLTRTRARKCHRLCRPIAE